MSQNVVLTDVNGEQIMPVTTSENVFTGAGVTLKETLKKLADGGSAVIIDTELSEESENPVQNKIITEKLNEVFQSVSNGKSLLASAITDKGVETDANATFETMSENISAITISKNPVTHPDIFNHMDIVGLNPVYSFYTRMSEDGTYWTVDDEKIYVPLSGNNNLIFGTPIFFTGYKFLCFDMEVTGNGAYCTSEVGLRKAVHSNPSDYFNPCTYRFVHCTSYESQSNYDGTFPWNNLTRQVVKVPVDDIEDACVICMHCCHCNVNIYGIWLE
jgi:hypothetical protein